jgi:lipopolysaccharide export LptBFGC system permease protein LptF
MKDWIGLFLGVVGFVLFGFLGRAESQANRPSFGWTFWLPHVALVALVYAILSRVRG